MADPKPGTFRYTSKDAKRHMAASQRGLDKAADRGIAAFKRKARRRGGTGDFSRYVRKERATGWDGRPAVRIVAYSKGDHQAVSPEFGTRRSRPVNALQAAIAAIQTRRR